jgi:hypothetical protein
MVKRSILSRRFVKSVKHRNKSRRIFSGGKITTLSINNPPNDVGSYTGETFFLNHGKRHGKGEMKYSDGSIYEGSWKYEGSIHEGSIYEKRTSGTYTVPGKYSFTGKWVSDKIYDGLYKDFVEDTIYRGTFENDKMSGVGELVDGDGKIYIVKFVNGKKEGMGTIIDRNRVKENHFWVNDVLTPLNGLDENITYISGDIYRGAIVNSKRSGKGHMIYALYEDDTRSDIYEGDWLNDKKSGMGKMIYVHGEIYEGMWLNDLRHGVGISWHRFNDDRTTNTWFHDRMIERGANPENVEIALEIHKAASKVDLDEYIDAIGITTDYSNVNEVDFKVRILSDFNTMITENIPENLQQVKRDELISIINKLYTCHLLRETNPNHKTNRNMIGKTMEFVVKQNKAFKELYVNTFIDDNAHAYNASGANALSCVGGILERFCTLVGSTVLTICLGEADACASNEEFVKLKKIFGGSLLSMNEVIQEWTNKSGNSDEEWNDELKNLSGDLRKANFVEFATRKYSEAGLLGKRVIADIELNANKNNLVFGRDTLYFGGKRVNSQKRTRSLKYNTNKKRLIKSNTSKKRNRRRRGKEH